MAWDPPQKTIQDVCAATAERRETTNNLSIAMPAELSFSWAQLVLSIGRTQTLSQARSKLSQDERLRFVHDVSLAIMAHVEIFVDAKNEKFAFTTLLDEQADEDRTSLASKVGAAVADLAMEAAGFRWRANARELNFTRKKDTASKKLPDFVYDDGNNDESSPSKTVLVEAKGSLSKFRATRGRLIALALKAYDEQIRSLVGEKADGIVIDGGCAVVFGAVPGQRSSTLVMSTTDPAVAASPIGARARSLSAATSFSMPEPMPMPQWDPQRQQTEQERQKDKERYPDRRGGGHGGGGDRTRDGEPEASPHGRIAFADYESVFLLCGATDAARLIRLILDGVPIDRQRVETSTQTFFIPAGAEHFLVADRFFWPRRFPGYIAVYRPSAEAILRAVANNRTGPPISVEMPVVPGDLGREDESITVQADGLAWLDRNPGPFQRKIWDLQAGDWQ
jgi:hypothetical protein